MKKLLTLLIISIVALTAEAQLITGKTSTVIKTPPSKDKFFIEAGVGYLAAPCFYAADACGVGLGVGWRHIINEHHNWDYFRISATFSTYGGNEGFVKLSTGYRYNTSKIINNRGSVYFSGGLGLALDFSEGAHVGFAYDLGLGINFSKLFYMGIRWDAAALFGKFEEYYYNDRYDNGYIYKSGASVGIIGLQFGFQF